MPTPTRKEAISPFQRYLQATMLNDTIPVIGMMALLAPDGVYVMSPTFTEGAPPPQRPYVLISTSTEVGLKYAFSRVANDNSQQLDIFSDEVTSDAKVLAIYDRLLYLFDAKYPVLAGFRALRATSVEFVSAYPDPGIAAVHGIVVVRPQLQVLS